MLPLLSTGNMQKTCLATAGICVFVQVSACVLGVDACVFRVYAYVFFLI